MFLSPEPLHSLAGAALKSNTLKLKRSQARISHKPVGVGTFDAPQLKNTHKQIDQQPNDVSTELYGCWLKLKILTIQFRSRAELAKRSNLRAAGGKR